MRPVAIVSYAETPFVRRTQLNDAELVMDVVTAALDAAQLDRHAIGFCISGSSDFLTGMPFSFVAALDAVGAWPPIQESHVEMDGAWALYEAWVRLQHGDIDTALVYAFGRSSLGDLQDVLVTQLDPYYVAPLWPDPISLAALQARALSTRAVWRARLGQRRGAGQEAAVATCAAPCSTSRTSCRRCAGTTARRSPTARRRSCWRRATAPSRCASGRPGFAASTIASSRIRWARAIFRARRRRSSRPRGGRGDGADRDRRAARAVLVAGAHRARRARARRPREHQSVGRRLGDQPAHGRRPRAARPSGAPHSRRHGHTHAGARHVGPCLQQNLVACWKVPREARSRHRRRADEIRAEARRRVAGRARARSGAARAGRRRADLRRHRRGRHRQGARHVRRRHDAGALSGRRARRRGQADAARAHRRLGRRLDGPRRRAPRCRRACTSASWPSPSRSSRSRTRCGRCRRRCRFSRRSSPAPAATSRPSFAPISSARARPKKWACSSRSKIGSTRSRIPTRICTCPTSASRR
jgi:hypothetical protein